MCLSQKKLDSHHVQKYVPGAEQIRQVGGIAMPSVSQKLYTKDIEKDSE
jgi:hypothetical protein